MKSRMTYYPIIREQFDRIEELAEVINRERTYCKLRLNGQKSFTFQERQLIANYLHVEVEEIKK